MTFDDGPTGDAKTTATLADLEGVNKPGTFFISGYYSKMSDEKTAPQLVNMKLGGHEIQSHTWSHPDITTLKSFQQLSRELNTVKTWAQNKLDEQGMSMSAGDFTIFRPPYLIYDATRLAWVNQLGYPLATTTIDTDDWTDNSLQARKDQITRGFRPGHSMIILMHDEHYIPGLIPWISDFFTDEGYRFVTMSECYSLCMEQNNCSVPCPYEVPEGYKYYPSKDSSGYDLYQANNRNITAIAAACDSNSACVAFNSNGWLKSRVNRVSV